MSVRQRVWNSSGQDRSAWVVDWRDERRSRHVKTFETEEEAKSFQQELKTAPPPEEPPRYGSSGTLNDDALDQHNGKFLLGAQAIADFLSDLLGRSVSTKNVYKWCDDYAIPFGRFEGKLIASPQALHEHFARRTGPNRRSVL